MIALLLYCDLQPVKMLDSFCHSIAGIDFTKSVHALDQLKRIYQ